MRDIVATIQAEQDEVIRAPLEHVPGRAGRARHRQDGGGPAPGRVPALRAPRGSARRASGVLVIGPNPIFLRYIAQVLPSLGETRSARHTIERLVAGTATGCGPSTRRRGPRSRATPAWPRCCGRAVAGPRRAPADDVVAADRLRRGPAAAATELAAAGQGRARGAPHVTPARDVLPRRLELARLARFAGAAAGDEAPAEARSGRPAGRPRLQRRCSTGAWPALSRRRAGPPAARQPGRPAPAADGLLEPRRAAARCGAPRPGGSPTSRWTVGRLALLDEAEALINGVPGDLRHVVVDEAQDLIGHGAADAGPPQPVGVDDRAGRPGPGHRARRPGRLGRRSRSISALRTTRELRELETGYRLPGEILDWASRLLPEAAPGLRAGALGAPGRPAAGGAPIRRRFAVAAASSNRSLPSPGPGACIGVIAPPSLLAGLREALAGAGLDVGPLDPDRLDHQVTVLGATGAKGLEFDATVVVEPAAILDEEPGGRPGPLRGPHPQRAGAPRAPRRRSARRARWPREGGPAHRLRPGGRRALPASTT